MDIDNAAKTVKGFAQTAGKKGEELFSISKLKLKEAQIKKDISVEYEKLGKMYYEAVKAGEENKLIFEEIISKIDELKAELKSVTDEINDIKGTVDCKCCGATNPVDADYCSKCGEKL